MLKFTEFLTEKRANPELNKKVSAYEELKPFAQEDDYFISFTSLDKIGINPGSTYGTPNGIYSYPLKKTWALYHVERNKDFSDYPFAADRPYIWCFTYKDKSKILFLEKYTKKDLERDVQKLEDMFLASKTKKDSSFDTFVKACMDNAYVPTPGGYIWNITRCASNNFDSTTNPSTNATNPNKWAALFRELGYEGVVDLAGKGIIHPYERTQAVFFQKFAIKDEKKVLNKKYVTLTQKDPIETVYKWLSSELRESGDKIKAINKSEDEIRFVVKLYSSTESNEYSLMNTPEGYTLISLDAGNNIEFFYTSNNVVVNKKKPSVRRQFSDMLTAIKFTVENLFY